MLKNTYLRLLTSVLIGFAVVIAPFLLMELTIDLINSSIGKNLTPGHIGSTDVVVVLFRIMCFGAIAGIAAAAITAIHKYLGLGCSIAAGMCSALAFCFGVNDAWPLSHYMMCDWKWLLSIAWSVILGISSAVVLRGVFRARYICLALFLCAEIALLLVFLPASQSLVN